MLLPAGEKHVTVRTAARLRPHSKAGGHGGDVHASLLRIEAWHPIGHDTRIGHGPDVLDGLLCDAVPAGRLVTNEPKKGERS